MMAEQTRLRPSGTYIDQTPIDAHEIQGNVEEIQSILFGVSTSLIGFLDCKITRDELITRTNNAAKVLQVLAERLPQKGT